jgi:hypothetical protein
MRGLILCLLALPVLGQEKLVSMSGVVVNSATGEPVKRALVSITPLFRQPSLSVRTALTDASGVFRFEGVSEGQYLCQAQKPQFVAAKESDGRCSAPSTDFRFGLAPLGVITGRIVDQDGLPLRLVNVYALRAEIQDGLKQIRTDRSVTTDDRGMYRLWNLSPGKYFIKASGFAASTVSYIGDNAPVTSGESFPTTYYGGGKVRDSATPIEIKPGSDAVADLTLTVDRGYRIQGTLANVAPRETVKFELVSGNDASLIRVTLNSETGRFEVAAVTPGSYTLRATQGNSVAETPITMPVSDLSGVAMRLEPPVEIPVNVRFTNEVKQVETIEGPQMAAGCVPMFHPTEGVGNVRVLQPGANPAVAPGRYRLTLQCFNAYVRSALYGSQDLMANPEVTVAPGGAVSIDILATNGSGTLTGRIENAGDNPWILLVPQFLGDAVFQTVEPQDFDMVNLAPGNYLAYAFSSGKDIEFRNRDFIRTLTGGVTVQIEDGKESKVTIPGVVR